MLFFFVGFRLFFCWIFQIARNFILVFLFIIYFFQALLFFRFKVFICFFWFDGLLVWLHLLLTLSFIFLLFYNHSINHKHLYLIASFIIFLLMCHFVYHFCFLFLLLGNFFNVRQHTNIFVEFCFNISPLNQLKMILFFFVGFTCQIWNFFFMYSLR